MAIPLAALGFLCKEQSLLVLVYLCLFEVSQVKLGSCVTDGALRKVPLCECRPFWAWRIRSTRRRASTSLLAIILLVTCLALALYVRLAIMQFSLPTFSRYVFIEAKPMRPIE